MFLSKFCQQELKFKWKFQAILETVLGVSLHPPSNGEWLTLIWVGILAVRFEVGGGYDYLPFLKLVRIIIETSYLARRYTHVSF